MGWRGRNTPGGHRERIKGDWEQGACTPNGADRKREPSSIDSDPSTTARRAAAARSLGVNVDCWRPAARIAPADSWVNGSRQGRTQPRKTETNLPVADHSPDARERYFKRYTTVVSVSAGSRVGSPYISHECPADSLRFAAIHFRIASCASFMRLYGPRWTATAARSNRRFLCENGVTI